MYLRASIIIIIIFFFTGLKAQSIYVNEEPAIKKLYSNFIRWNKEKEFVNGWRIQIINTDDRRKMEKAISSFRYHFPYINNVS